MPALHPEGLEQEGQVVRGGLKNRVTPAPLHRVGPTLRQGLLLPGLRSRQRCRTQTCLPVHRTLQKGCRPPPSLGVLPSFSSRTGIFIKLQPRVGVPLALAFPQRSATLEKLLLLPVPPFKAQLLLGLSQGWEQLLRTVCPLALCRGRDHSTAVPAVVVRSGPRTEGRRPAAARGHPTPGTGIN